MKVNDTNDAVVQAMQQYQRGDASPKVADKPVGSATAGPEETVTLSDKARDAARMRDTLAALPDIREEKVQDIKSRIEQGAYNVNSEDIAKKMVGESLLDLFA